jgi:hypothetical protein
MIIYKNDKNISKSIPIFELSYEKRIDKKVRSDLCFALPYGVKSLYWFTIHEGDYVCLNIPMINGIIQKDKIKVEQCCFNNDICYGNGTLVLGVKLNDKPIIILYDIYYYKNIPYFNNMTSYKKKLEILGDLLHNNIKNTIIFKEQLSFCLPCIDTTFNNVYDKIKYANYRVYSFVFVNLFTKYKNNEFLIYVNNNNNNEKIYKTFMIKPDKDDMFDMYDLYIYNNSKYEYYDKAHINSIRMSYDLNKYFNNSKYVNNLDYIEESEDDEDDNEVLLENNTKHKAYAYVKCYFNKYVNLWQPDIIINSNNKLRIVTLKELK